MSKIVRPESRNGKKAAQVSDEEEDDQVESTSDVSGEEEETEQDESEEVDMDGPEDEQEDEEEEEDAEEEEEDTPPPPPVKKTVQKATPKGVLVDSKAKSTGKQVSKSPPKAKPVTKTTSKAAASTKRKREEEEEEVEEDEEKATFTLLSKQLTKKSIPARPVNPEAQHKNFLLTYVSPDLRRTKWEYKGKNYSNPKAPLKVILQEESVDFDDKKLKAWTEIQVLMKRDISDEKPSWILLNDAIPPHLRSTKARPAAKPVAKTTPPPPKKSKATKPPSVIDDREERGQKKAKASNKHSVDLPRVHRYASRKDDLEIEDDQVYDLAGYSVKYGIIKMICSLDVGKVLQLVPVLNRTLREMDEKEVTSVVPNGHAEEKTAKSVSPRTSPACQPESPCQGVPGEAPVDDQVCDLAVQEQFVESVV